MRKRILATLMFATLPFAAGFAFCGDVAAQGIQYEGPAPTMQVGAAPAGGMDMMRLSQLEQQIRDLTNQLEQRDFQLRQLQSSFDKYTADTSARIQDLESRLSGGAPVAPAQEQFETPASDAPPPPAALQNQPAGAVVPPVAGSTPNPMDEPYKPDATAASRTDRNLGQIVESANGNDGTVTSGKPQTTSAAQAYDQAFSYLQQNNYQDAQRAFSDFLKNYASHPLAANAQYWLGESYFAQTQYTTAAKTFAKAFQDHPQGQKAPDSLLKLALTLEKLNKKDDACLTLQELSKRFTSGPASVVKRASEEGQRMGCKS